MSTAPPRLYRPQSGEACLTARTKKEISGCAAPELGSGAAAIVDRLTGEASLTALETAEPSLEREFDC
jgi:hypothetical protein